MNTRNAVIGLILAAIVAAVVVACGGGGGGGNPAPQTGGGTGFGVSGTLTGSTAPTTLKLTGVSDTVMQADGGFGISGLADGATFNLQVVNGTDRCAVSANGAGKIAGANVTGVTITCGAQTNEIVVRSSPLSGAQENPPVVSSGSGRGGVVFDPNTNVITGGVSVFNIVPSGVALFQTGVNTPIATLGNGGDGHTFFIPTPTMLDSGQKAALLAGNLYFDVFTAAHPLVNPGDTGEIRGQINLQGGVIAGVSTLNFAQEQAGGTDLSCTSSAATGQGTVIVDRATLLIVTSYMTHNVGAGTIAAHIHTSVNPLLIGCASGGPACSGDVIIGFVQGPALNYPADTTFPLTTTNVSDFLADTLYFNIHSSPNCGSGEIRGNIAHTPGL